MPQTVQERQGYLVAPLLVAIAWALTAPIYLWVDFVFGSMVMLFVILYVSIRFGIRPAVLASLLGSLYLNYYFVEPILHVSIGGGPDLVALLAFVIMAVVVGGLSQSAAQRATEAERGRREIERLYGELQMAFEKTSQMEAVKRSEQMKSALLDAVTHDLRTPLTAIKAAATTLMSNVVNVSEDESLSPQHRRELIQVVIEESDRLNNFVEELLVFARIQGKSVDTIEAPGSIEDVIGAAMQRASLMLKDFKVTVEHPEPEPQVANPRIAAQALYALLDNAAKYSPRGSTIAISVEIQDELAYFAVDDEGPGIPYPERELVFSRFYRRSQATSKAPSGLGMGLAIARGLVEAIGGHIAVADKPTPGTRFEFSIPLSKAGVKQEQHVETAD